MSADTAIKVAVRIRPIVKSEEARGCQVIVEKTPSQPQVVVQTERPDAYTFNYVFAPEDAQDKIYDNAVKSMIPNLFKGKASRTQPIEVPFSNHTSRLQATT